MLKTQPPTQRRDRLATQSKEGGRDASYASLRIADTDRPHGVAELERLAGAAHLAGRAEESLDLWTRLHHALVGVGEVGRAVRVAIQLAFRFHHQGETARAGGWHARARRLVATLPPGVEEGFLSLPEGLAKVMAGETAAGLALFDHAAQVADEWGDRELALFALHGRGRALLRLGRTREGLAALDELMLAVTHGEIPTPFVGDVYCSMLAGCREAYDLRRAGEWTEALVRWCRTQEAEVPFRAHCLLHRAEILQWQGAWAEALDEASAARGETGGGGASVARGEACYRVAELHRVRGEFVAAEAAYRDASVAGHAPQPGLALLRLAAGQMEQAATAIRRALAERVHLHERPPLLAAGVEIALAANDLTAAVAWAKELSTIAARSGVPFLRATSLQASGAVDLANGDLAAGMTSLRVAGATWRELRVPYEAARVACLMGDGCRAAGDADGMLLEFEAARRTFEALGAAPDLQRVQSAPSSPQLVGGLTPREREVLAITATGKTNRAVAVDLGISEKTVARHLSNIFLKLGLSTRAAATAWAFRHRIV